MGLNAGGMYSGTLIKGLEREIKDALSRAASEVGAGRGDQFTQKWFGDTRGPFQQRLARSLSRMRSVINVRTIPVTFTPLGERDVGTNADAMADDAEHLSLGDTYAIDVRLNLAFQALPRHAARNGTGDIDTTTHQQSQFGTLVHELSHGILGTDDVKRGGQTAYGANAAYDLAQNSSYNAKNNAENWGMFVEEFRA